MNQQMLRTIANSVILGNMLLRKAQQNARIVILAMEREVAMATPNVTFALKEELAAAQYVTAAIMGTITSVLAIPGA